VELERVHRVIFERGAENDLWPRFRKGCRYIDAAATGHLYIEQNYLRPQVDSQLHGFGAGLRFARDFHILLGRQKLPQASPGGSLIVHD
jgi:hypothetical protein